VNVAVISRAREPKSASHAARWAINATILAAVAFLPRAAKMLDDGTSRLPDPLETLLHFTVALGAFLCGLELGQWASGGRDAVSLKAWSLVEAKPFEVVIRNALFAGRVFGHGSVMLAEFAVPAHRSSLLVLSPWAGGRGGWGY
jgi:hypothetical protein